MALRNHPQSSHGYGLISSVTTGAEYGAASYLAGYAIGAYPEHLRIKNVPAIPAIGAAAKVVSLAISHFGLGNVAGGLVGKSRTHLDILGNAFIGTYLATIGTSHGMKKSGRAIAAVSAGDVTKLKAAVPGATILGVAQQAPPGRVLSNADIEAIARRVK